MHWQELCGKNLKPRIFWLHRSCHCQKLSRLGKIAQIYLPCLLLIARVLKSKQYCNLAADIFLLLGVPSPLPRAHHNILFATVASQFPNFKSARQKAPIHIFSMTLLLFCENQFERIGVRRSWCRKYENHRKDHNVWFYNFFNLDFQT